MHRQFYLDLSVIFVCHGLNLCESPLHYALYWYTQTCNNDRQLAKGQKFSLFIHIIAD